MDMMSTDLVDIRVFLSCLEIPVRMQLGRLGAGPLNPEGLHLESFESTLPSFAAVPCGILLDGFETIPENGR